MGQNNGEDINQKIRETKKAIEQATRAVQKASTGNFIGAAIEALKSDVIKKKIKKQIIKSILPFFATTIMAGALLCGILAIKDEMIDLLSKQSIAVSGFFSSLWKKFTDDEWIKLDYSYEYIINKETGEILRNGGYTNR